ncbi:MAG: putative 2-dehydropantoate 2-reductase [Bacteroidales bacterium]|nr:putative 2-dehydropantoate 2-reductase [Candidatus Physcocola equi]
MKLRYGIIGAGAIGGYYGGRLAQHGADIHFLYHSEYEQVKNNGLRVDSVNGDFHLTDMNVYAHSEDMPKCDVVIVALKTTQSDKVASLVKPLLKEGSHILLVQNGLGYEEELAKELPDYYIGGGLAFICSSRIAPGHILHADYGALTVAWYKSKKNEDVANQIKTDFEQAEVPYTTGDDLNFFRWRKLVWNIPYNGLAVALMATTEEIMKNPSTRQLAADMMKEVVTAARACGAMIKDSFIDRMLENTEKMKPYAPSMRLDFDNHRPMEIQAIYSNPIQIAKAAGVEMPKVEMLEQQLRFIESREIANSGK